ncbi:MAG: DUF2284 domain-containing protein [Bacteroidales bacterium]
MDKNQINQIIKSKGFSDFKWIDVKEIVIAQWVRFKCMFGCNSYGTKATCPPQVPSIAECKAFFGEYKDAVLIHIPKKLENPEDRVEWGKSVNEKLIEIEKDIFLLGFRKAFILFMDECQICKDCAVTRDACHYKMQARPCPEGLGVDVFETAHKCNFPIEVLKDYRSEMNRYSILLIE